VFNYSKWILLITLFILVTFLLSLPSIAQDYQKLNRRYTKGIYKKHNSKYARACNILERRRNKPVRKPLLASNRSYKKKPMAEVASYTVSSTPAPKPEPKPEPVRRPYPQHPKVEEVSEDKLEQLHAREMEELAENNLPVPSSEKHEEVRNRVSSKLASKTNVYPLDLEPLYFKFDEDEFSVVDMEPFLMAAEYALQ